ncbi:MAG TPA: GIY-YIG nuclease family protein [Candidatus Paceibacterota bacterium]
MEKEINMKYWVYVLRDDKGKFYKGMTNNLERRLKEHKNKHTITTARMGNISLAYQEEFDSFNEARKRELYFKSSAGRRFLKNKLGS